MPLPSWVDFGTAQQFAAVMSRELSGSSETWATLFSHAQAVLASRTATRESEELDIYDLDKWNDLVCAARVLDSAATEKGVKEQGDRTAAAILAACAFGMSGTAVSARAVILGHQLLRSGLSPGELTALALSSPPLSGNVLPELPSGSSYRACVENLSAFLATGGDKEFDMAATALSDSIRTEGGSWEGYLLRLSRLSLAHARRLSTRKVLHTYEYRFPAHYLGNLVDDNPMLLPSQYTAITKHGLLEQGRHVLVALPTGTGKTLLGELALLASLGRNSGLVCYVSPYVALGHQVVEQFRARVPRQVRVFPMFGEYKEPEPMDPANRPEIIVATPERFDALLRLRPDLLPLIRCVVFDEAHLIGNDQRGVRLEGLLTRLRLANLRGEQTPRFVLLSAVLSNATELGEWLGISPSQVVEGTWRPTAKRLVRWDEDGRLRLHAGDDPLSSKPSELLGEKHLPWPNRGFFASDKIGAINKQEPQVLENVAYLAAFQYQQYRQPVLCICTSRARTRHLATQLMSKFDDLMPLPASIRRTTNLIDQKYHYLRPLRDALLKGVAYHNSSLPHDVRQGIEKAVSARDLKVVAATTTLAEGVDLPFRVTILADWLVFNGEKSVPMDSLLFKNIAGRCGRAGQFTEGDTIVFDNPVGDGQWTAPGRRRFYQDGIFSPLGSPALTSAINRLDQHTAVSTLGSQLMAAIQENPGIEGLHRTVFEHSFSSHTANADGAQRRIDLAYQDILDPAEGEPLAIAASPAQLTEFGIAANSAGLSPVMARKLRAGLTTLSDLGGAREDLLIIAVALLKELAQVPEQGNRDLRRAVVSARNRPIVRLDEMGFVLDRWLRGASIENIFAELPRNLRSARQPALEFWIRGVPEDSKWNDQFATFVDYVNNCLVFFLPWVLRAAKHLAELDNHLERPWNDWARFVELGLDNAVGADLLDDNIISDRETAREIGLRLEALSDGLPNPSGHARQIFETLAGTDSPDLPRFLDWYRRRENRLGGSL